MNKEIIPFQKYFIELVRSSFSYNELKRQIKSIDDKHKKTYYKLLENLPQPTSFDPAVFNIKNISEKKFRWQDVLYLQEEFYAPFLSPEWNKHMWQEFEGYLKSLNKLELKGAENIFETDRKFRISRYKGCKQILENLPYKIKEIKSFIDVSGIYFSVTAKASMPQRTKGWFCYVVFKSEIIDLIKYRNEKEFLKTICEKFNIDYNPIERLHTDFSEIKNRDAKWKIQKRDTNLDHLKRCKSFLILAYGATATNYFLTNEEFVKMCVTLKSIYIEQYCMRHNIEYKNENLNTHLKVIEFNTLLKLTATSSEYDRFIVAENVLDFIYKELKRYIIT